MWPCGNLKCKHEPLQNISLLPNAQLLQKKCDNSPISLAPPFQNRKFPRNQNILNHQYFCGKLWGYDAHVFLFSCNLKPSVSAYCNDDLYGHFWTFLNYFVEKGIWANKVHIFLTLADVYTNELMSKKMQQNLKTDNCKFNWRKPYLQSPRKQQKFLNFKGISTIEVQC